MNSTFRSSIWKARELLFILLLSIVIDRIATAQAEHQDSLRAGTPTLASFYPEAFLSSCKETGEYGQNNKYGFLSNRPTTAP